MHTSTIFEIIHVCIYLYIYTQLHSNHIYILDIQRCTYVLIHLLLSVSLFAYTRQCVDLDAESLVALGDQKVCATPCHADRTTASKVGGRPVRWVASDSRWEPAEGDLNVEGWWVGWLGASCKTDTLISYLKSAFLVKSTKLFAGWRLSMWSTRYLELAYSNSRSPVWHQYNSQWI